MTNEEKQLLLKDLCTRLPYNVIVDRDGRKCPVLSITNEGEVELEIREGYYRYYFIEEIKPYLRPMSSMAEEEKKELRQEHVKDEKLYAECLTKAANGDNSMRGKVIPHFAADWCNKNHFDYRGLIPMNLALEAPEGMYES